VPANAVETNVNHRRPQTPPGQVGRKAWSKTKNLHSGIPVNSTPRHWVAKVPLFILHCKAPLRLEHNPAI
jgi:hypothetical protein